jgi:nitrite reductase/ring-hydroxylating ferredoxin subunit
MSECPTSRSTEVEETKLSLTRRNFFAGFAVAATSLGLTGIASSAEAASKKYKVCATKDIKVGGGSIFFIASANMFFLITQPKKDVFRAFNPACTHKGIPVSKIEGTSIRCKDGHQALFDLNSGAVKRGPAVLPLQKYTLSVESKNIYVTLTK